MPLGCPIALKEPVKASGTDAMLRDALCLMLCLVTCPLRLCHQLDIFSMPASTAVLFILLPNLFLAQAMLETKVFPAVADMAVSLTSPCCRQHHQALLNS